MPLSNTGNQTLALVKAVSDLSERVEYLEHFSNQQSILVDTLGDIMEELKKQEQWNGKFDERYQSG